MKLLIENTGYKRYKEDEPFIHSHRFCEIITYTSGNGVLFLDGLEYQVKCGDIAIIPAGISHASLSINDLRSIYVTGDLGYGFNFSAPFVITEDLDKEGVCLANLIYNNRYGNKDYLISLCNTYITFIMQNLKIEDGLTQAVREIARKIERSFCDYNVKINEFLKESGYAEDYVRANFKKVTGKTPNEYLTDIRIKHAVKLIEGYANALQLSEIADRCGYDDYIYFSRKFKKTLGVSPQQYKRELLK